jgi:RHS repeat-associated protein
MEARTPDTRFGRSSSRLRSTWIEHTAVGGTTHVWDANGSLVDNGTHLFLYDYKNHIVQVKLKSSGSVIASYRYDALGRRVEKNCAGTTTRFILTMRRTRAPGELSQVVSVFDDAGNWRQNFVWNDEVDGIQMLEQRDLLDYDTDGNTTEITRSFYHRNALGSVMEITDMNQAVAVSYRYDPYGNITITRGGTPQTNDPIQQHWSFGGQFHDEETGLYHCRARYSDPNMGRYLQRSPFGWSDGPNPFTIVGSNPVNLRNPAGAGALWNGLVSMAPYRANYGIGFIGFGGLAALYDWFHPPGSGQPGDFLPLLRFRDNFQIRVKTTITVQVITDFWEKIGEQDHTWKRQGRWLIHRWNDVEQRAILFLFHIKVEIWIGFPDRDHWRGRQFPTYGEFLRGSRGWEYFTVEDDVLIVVFEERLMPRVKAVLLPKWVAAALDWLSTIELDTPSGGGTSGGGAKDGGISGGGPGAANGMPASVGGLGAGLSGSLGPARSGQSMARTQMAR